MDATPEKLRRYAARDQLINGESILIRAIAPNDKAALQDGMHRLSPESAYFRFSRHKYELSQRELAQFTELDFDHHVGLVAVVDDDTLLVGVGRYIVCQQEPFRAAEVAFTVDDAHHGLGIGTILLHHLARIARSAEITEFRASVLSANRKMLEVLFHSGLPLTHTLKDGMVEVRLSLDNVPVD